MRYIIRGGEGGDYAQRNPGVMGNAWFPQKITMVPDANTELLGLDGLDYKNEVLVHDNFKEYLSVKEYAKDTTATIQLIKEQPNQLVYDYSSASERFTVFSEVYFNKGWNAYVDGVLTPHFRANYMLRAMLLPKGKHTIEFKFEPQVVSKGSKITLGTSILLILLLLGGFIFSRKSTSSNEKA